MPRRPVEVRRAGADDLPMLSALVLAAADEARGAPGPAAIQSHQRLTDILDRTDIDVHLAVAGDVPVGLAVVRLGDVMVLTGTSAVRIEQLYVLRDWRRRGIAHLLMTAALATAERSGAEEVACIVPASGRDAHRFLARLGFSRVVTMRATQVGRLRARLAADTDPGRRRLALDTLVARRRRQLDRLPTPPGGLPSVAQSLSPAPVTAPATAPTGSVARTR